MSRIALVTQGYRSAGGVQTVSRWLVDGLRSAGHEVTIFNVAASFRDPLSRRIVAPASWRRGPRLCDGPEQQLVEAGALLAELEPIRYLPSRVLTNRLRDFDVIQVVAGSPALAVVASKAGRPIALQVATTVKWERVSIHRSQPLSRRLPAALMTNLTGLVERRALAVASDVFVENPLMLAEVQRIAPQTGAHLAPPGVDIATFKPAKKWNPDGPIVSIGRLGEPRKAWHRIFTAYAHLRRELDSVPKLIVAGRGTLSRSDEELLDHLGIRSAVDVRSDIPQDQMIELLQSASMFWQASHEEGLGIAVIEAMACGVPIVATATAGTLMTVSPEVGYLIEQHDADDPANWFEPARTILRVDGRRKSEQALQRARDTFSTPATLQTYLEVYERLTS